MEIPQALAKAADDYRKSWLAMEAQIEEAMGYTGEEKVPDPGYLRKLSDLYNAAVREGDWVSASALACYGFEKALGYSPALVEYDDVPDPNALTGHRAHRLAVRRCTAWAQRYRTAAECAGVQHGPLVEVALLFLRNA